MKKNTKIIRLTENDLERMVRRIIKESDDDYETSTPIKPVTIHGKTYKFVEDLPIRELGIGSYTVDGDKGIVMVDGDTPLQDWLTQDMDAEDYMSSEEDLINAAYELMYDLGDEDVEILDLQDAANILDEELYEGNHGPIMNKKIEDLLTQIYEIIGYPDAEDYMDDELEWAKDSLQAKEGFDWLLHEPLDNLVGLRFDWDGNLYEVTAAFEDEDEGGIWLNALDPETGEDYDDSIPLDALVADLEDGIASFID